MTPAALTAIAEGSWIVDLSGYDGGGDDPAYEARRRVWIGR